MVAVTTLILPWCCGTSWSSLFLERLRKVCFIITTSTPKYMSLMKRSQGMGVNATAEKNALQEVTKAIRETMCFLPKAAATLLTLLPLELSSRLLLLHFREGKQSLRVYSQAAFLISGQETFIPQASLHSYLSSII